MDHSKLQLMLGGPYKRVLRKSSISTKPSSSRYKTSDLPLIPAMTLLNYSLEQPRGERITAGAALTWCPARTHRVQQNLRWPDSVDDLLTLGGLRRTNKLAFDAVRKQWPPRQMHILTTYLKKTICDLCLVLMRRNEKISDFKIGRAHV